jgi:hypothetical protein
MGARLHHRLDFIHEDGLQLSDDVVDSALEL